MPHPRFWIGIYLAIPKIPPDPFSVRNAKALPHKGVTIHEFLGMSGFTFRYKTLKK